MSLLLLACASGPWTSDAALGPALARLDRDGDGRVTEAEYTAVAFAGPSFAGADADRSGALDLDELGALVRSQDPTTFHLPPPTPPPPRAPGDRASAGQIAVLRVLESLREEVVAADPEVPVPTEAELQAAAATGALDTPEVTGMLRRLEEASKAAGVGFPKGLGTGARDRPQ